jgi:hypothetical protein
MSSMIITAHSWFRKGVVSRPVNSPVYASGFLISLLLLVISAGCSSSAYTWHVRTNSTGPAPAANKETLERDPVAVLGAFSPALGGTEIGVGLMLTQVLKKLVPQAKLIESRDAYTRINTKGAAEDYMKLRADAARGYVLSREQLQKVGAAIGARYLFQPYVAAFTQTLTNRWSFMDVRLMQTRSSILRLSLQLWDAETGELLWASVAEAQVESEGVGQEPVYFEDAVRISLGGMMADFLAGKTSSTYDPLNKYIDQLVHIPQQEVQ